MGKKDNRLTQLRKDVDKLRKNYSNAMTSANKAVYQGIDRLAEHELAALKKHYEEALKNLKKLRKGGDPRDLATEQLRMLQKTIDRIMSNARESLKILDDTRQRINKEVRASLDSTAAGGTQKATAKRSTAKKKAPARKSTTSKSGKGSGGTAKKTAASRSKSGTSSAKKKTTASRRKTTASGGNRRKTAAKSASSTRS